MQVRLGKKRAIAFGTTIQPITNDYLQYKNTFNYYLKRLLPTASQQLAIAIAAVPKAIVTKPLKIAFGKTIDIKSG